MLDEISSFGQVQVKLGLSKLTATSPLAFNAKWVTP
jgi:hypothetical protein